MTHDDWLDAAAKELIVNIAITGDWGANLKGTEVRVWLEHILATRPSPGRAEVERAVDEYAQLVSDRQMLGVFGPAIDAKLDAARARLLALYAEPVGEVMWVVNGPPYKGSYIHETQVAEFRKYGHAVTRVRVIPVEEGA